MDCVLRLAAVRQELYGGSAVTRDDFAVGSRHPEDELAAALGGDWRPLDGPPQDAEPWVAALGPGATAFMLVSPENGPGHAFALRNQGGFLFWLETQAGPGARVRSIDDGPAVAGGDVRVIVADANGRAVPPDSLPQAPADADALRLSPNVRRQYGALGRELELSYVVHSHDGDDDDDDGDETILTDARTGIELVTDTWRRWTAGGRYFESRREAERSRLGRAERVEVKITEIVTPPERVLGSGEESRVSNAEVSDAVVDIIQRLSGARKLRNGQGGPGSRGTPLRQLFGDDPRYRFAASADHLTVLSPPGATRKTYAQLTVGTPLAGTLDFLKSASQYVRSSARRRYLRQGLRFGDAMAREFLEDRVGQGGNRYVVPAMENVPGVADLRAATTLLYTHVIAVAETFVLAFSGEDAGRAKNVPLGSLRTSFAAIHRSLPDDVRAFLEQNSTWIREELRARVHDTLGPQIGTYERRQRRAGKTPREFFSYLLEYQNSATVGDYIDNLLLPRERRRIHVDQGMAMNIRTNVDELDYGDELDDDDGLRHGLILLEMRDLGASLLSLDDVNRRITLYARWARDAYALAEGISRNRTTAGVRHVDELTEAVRELLAYRTRRHGTVYRVREFLNTAARLAPGPIRAPLVRGDVTTSLLADAIVALYRVREYGDEYAGDAVLAVEAVRDAVRDDIARRRPRGYRNEMRDLADDAGRVLSALRRRQGRAAAAADLSD